MGVFFWGDAPLWAEDVVLFSLPEVADARGSAGAENVFLPRRSDASSAALSPAEPRDAGPPAVPDNFSSAVFEEERAFQEALNDPPSAIPLVPEKNTAIRIVIDRSEYTLHLLEGNTLLKSYSVGLGRAGHRTPVGACRIVSKLVDPHYVPRDNPDRLIPPGPENPVGTRWLGLSWDHYGIHGTNNPSSIGRAVSLGCIRMKNEDVEELFKLVSIGTSVEVIP